MLVLGQSKEEVPFAGWFPIDGAFAVGNAHVAFDFRNDCRRNELITRFDWTAETHLVDLAKDSNLTAVFFRIKSSVTPPTCAMASMSRTPGMMGLPEVAHELRFVEGDIL